MATLKIEYRLSEAGQRASLISGGDGKAVQFFSIDHTHPAFATAIATADVSSDGSATLDTNRSLSEEGQLVPPINWDTIATVEQVLEGEELRRNQLVGLIAAHRLEKTNATLEVLTNRKTTTNTRYVSGLGFSFLSPAWPHKHDEVVATSPSALAWLRAIEDTNAATQIEMDAAQAAKEQSDAAAAAQAQVEKDAKEAARLARRAEMGVGEDETLLRVEDGCLANVPCYDNHSRSKNWLAVISVSPTSPGGLGRDFQEKCKGDLYYQASGLIAGTPIEFGADSYSSRGRKSPTRWYGVVTRRVVYRPGTDEEREYVVCTEHSTGKAAVKASSKLAKEEAANATS